MEQIETQEPRPAGQCGGDDPSKSASSQQVETAACSTCGGAASQAGHAPSFVYALGRIQPRFPNLGAEKEFAQVAARSSTQALTDQQTLQAVLSKRENRYLARQLCWVLTIEGIETYILRLRDPLDLELLTNAVRPVPRPTDVDVVIGLRGPIAPPELCNGLLLPIVAVDQTYSFDVDTLMRAIPRPEKISAKEFGPAAEELFARIQQLADNAGATDEHRAFNYMAVRYPAIYSKTAEQFAANSSLSAVEIRRSALSGTRRIFDIIFSYTGRTTAVTEKFSVRVDVTDEFPFLVRALSPTVDVL